MNKEIENKYLGEANMFKALAHPTRLFIINTIKDKDMCVKELASIVGIDISTMSKHLDVLKKSGIIKGIKEKNYVYYSLAIPCVLEFMSCAIRVKNKHEQE